jgi:biotin carboxylase
MKKVLLLGGSHFQVPSVKTARDLGYHVITCDYLSDNPGHKFSHEYHNVSTTDKDAVLKLSESLKIDGIVCYASDPSAPIAAYVAEQMGLQGNPYESVVILAYKDKFRDFLTKNGFRVPRAKGYRSYEEARKEAESFVFPVMVKPVDSSGSKGVSKISSVEELKFAFDYALGFSRSKRIIIEEFVQKSGYQIAGDGFSWNGKLVFRCFANEHFNAEGNPFVPIGESWPYNMPKRVHDKVHSEIQRLLALLKMKHGAYNFDIRIDQDENPILMEIGPRNGGNLIPQVTRYATGVDMVAYTIKAAMGEDCSDLKMVEPRGYWSCYMIHSKKAGVFQKVIYDKFFEERNIVENNLFCKKGDPIDSFNGSNGTLGTMILKFDTMDEMLEKMDHMDKYINVILD